MKTHQNKSKIYSKIKQSLSDTQFLTYWIVGIGVVIMLIGAVIGNLLFNRNVPAVYYNILFMVTLFFPLISCVFMILRREIARPYGMSSIEGVFAVLIGGIMLIIILCAEIYLLGQIIHYFQG